MAQHKTPELSDELLKRIRIVRRDSGNMLFHFTRAPTERFIEVVFGNGDKMTMSGSAGAGKKGKWGLPLTFDKLR
jgi:hypothetical protein